MTFRISAVTLGGYGLTSALCALAGMAVASLGVALTEAMLGTVLLGYIFYIALIMWAFAERKTLKRPCTILVLAAVTMTLTSFLAPLALTP